MDADKDEKVGRGLYKKGLGFSGSGWDSPIRVWGLGFKPETHGVRL